MNKPYIVALALALVLLVAAAGVAGAGSSASYAINWQVLSGGGAPASGGTISLNATLGQTAIGPATSSAYQLGSGYWVGASVAPAPADLLLFLPIVTKS